MFRYTRFTLPQECQSSIYSHLYHFFSHHNTLTPTQLNQYANMLRNIETMLEKAKTPDTSNITQPQQNQHAQMLDNIKKILANPEKYQLKEATIDPNMMAQGKAESKSTQKYSAF